MSQLVQDIPRRNAQLGSRSGFRRQAARASGAELAPAGVDAVFDHVGGPGIVESFRLLARGGTLVAYGTAATRDDAGSSRLPVLALIAVGVLMLLLRSIVAGDGANVTVFSSSNTPGCRMP